MSKTIDWRARLPVHPAAELFPLMSDAELKELAEDIKANGARVSPIIWSPANGQPCALLDGRNRLDALAALGLLYEIDHHDGIGLRTWTGTEWAKRPGRPFPFRHVVGDDPYALVLSLNVHRRHLTPEQKRDLIAKLLKAKPEASNVTVAKQAKADDKTVAKVRRGLEATSEVPRLEKTVGQDGKARTAKPQKRKLADNPRIRSIGETTVVATARKHVADIVDLMKLMTETELRRFWQEMIQSLAPDLAPMFRIMTKAEVGRGAKREDGAAVPISDEEALTGTWSRKDEPSRATQAKAGRP